MSMYMCVCMMHYCLLSKKEEKEEWLHVECKRRRKYPAHHITCQQSKGTEHAYLYCLKNEMEGTGSVIVKFISDFW